MLLKILSGLIFVLLVAGCSSNSQEEELRAALDRIEALEQDLEPSAPPTTAEAAPKYTRISSSYARRIATDALIDLTGRNTAMGFGKRVERWTEELVMANPGVTDLAPEEFDAWFREKIEKEYERLVANSRAISAANALKKAMGIGGDD